MPEGLSVSAILALAGVVLWIVALLGGFKIKEIDFRPLPEKARAPVFIAGTVLISFHCEMGVTKGLPEGLYLLPDKSKPQEARPNANREIRKEQHFQPHSGFHAATKP